MVTADITFNSFVRAISKIVSAAAQKTQAKIFGSKNKFEIMFRCIQNVAVHI